MLQKAIFSFLSLFSRDFFLSLNLTSKGVFLKIHLGILCSLGVF